MMVVCFSSIGTCNPYTGRPLHALFLQFAASQADQLGPDC